MYDFLSSLENILSTHSIIPPRINLSDKDVVRFKSLGICKDTCCYYMIFANRIGAAFGCWRRDIHQKWFVKSYDALTFVEKRDYKIQSDRLKKEKEERHKIAILKCKTIWEATVEPDPDHPYLLKKKIKPLYIRQVGKNLVVPIYAPDGSIQCLQYIQPDGFKLYHIGASPKGGYMAMGEKITDPIRICEGYATGCSIYEAIGETVLVCFTAYNLVNIAKFIRKNFPEHNIHICADDDRKTEEKIGINPGLKYALISAKEIGATVIYPDFTNISNAETASDFNDLMCLSGIESLESQLLLAKKEPKICE